MRGRMLAKQGRTAVEGCGVVFFRGESGFNDLQVDNPAGKGSGTMSTTCH